MVVMQMQGKKKVQLVFRYQLNRKKFNEILKNNFNETNVPKSL